MKKNAVILFTSCVYPNGMSYTVVNDPLVRIQEYCNALSYYISLGCFKIVVVDNSGYLYNEFRHIDKSKLEILSFCGNNYDRKLGKGYGEYAIIRFAVDHSEFIRLSDGPIIKVSGRHIITNLRPIINLYSFNSFFYRNLFFAQIKEVERWIISDCFVAPIVFFRNSSSFFSTINDSTGNYFEHCLFHAVFELKRKHIISFIPFPFSLKQKGVSGSTGKELSYDGSTMRLFIKSVLYYLKLDAVVGYYNRRLR